MKKNVDSRILEKIQKLLALAESENEHEAALAMERANELLLRHNLSAEEVSDSDVTSYDSELIKVVPVESKFIFTILKKHFFIDIIQRESFAGRTPKGRKIIHKRYCYVGETINLEVALYTDAFLRRAYKRLWQEYKAVHSAPEKSRQAYYVGLTRGILEKLNTQKGKVESETGLVWKGSAAVQEYINKKFGRLEKLKNGRYNRDLDASSAGREAGSNLELTKALKRNDHASHSGRHLGA